MKEQTDGVYTLVVTIRFGSPAKRRVMKEIRGAIVKAISSLSLALPITSVVGRIEREDTSNDA